ncbi:MAG: CinA family protein [Phycisphaerales bacterium]|nr:MAG: CinA family protein [Phycisphaerales bacterium]
MMGSRALQVEIGGCCRRISNVILVVVCLSCLPVPAATGPGARASDGPGREPTPYMIIVTGSELLEGAYADGHTFFLTRTLRPLGLRCVGSMCVGDNQAEVTEALRFAGGRAKLIIVTGGLGPTENDITREAISAFTGIALAEHAEVLAAMARRFNVAASKLRANLRRQTQTPVGGTYLKNSNGTAVGLVFEAADAVIVALPGPPGELQGMVREELVPYLSRRFGTRLPGLSLRLRFVGLGQSQIDQTLKDHVRLGPDIETYSQFEGGRVDFTFSLPGKGPKDKARLEELKRQIVKHLGEYIYADDERSLEQHVVDLLRGRGQRLALAEASSGGSLAAALSGAEGAERVLAGAYVAASVERLRGLLRAGDDNERSGGASDRKSTSLLAQAAAEATGSEWAIAVSERHRDDGGRAYVEVALRLPDARVESTRVAVRGSGEMARARLSTRLLDQLRRKLR